MRPLSPVFPCGDEVQLRIILSRTRLVTSAALKAPKLAGCCASFWGDSSIRCATCMRARERMQHVRPFAGQHCAMKECMHVQITAAGIGDTITMVCIDHLLQVFSKYRRTASLSINGASSKSNQYCTLLAGSCLQIAGACRPCRCLKAAHGPLQGPAPGLEGRKHCCEPNGTFSPHPCC